MANFLEPTKCPQTYRLAYDNGLHCCKHGFEKIDTLLGEKCDGSQISPSSLCCKDDDAIKCPSGFCEKWGMYYT